MLVNLSPLFMLLSMAKDLNIGIQVKTKVTKISGARGATLEFEKQASNAW